MAEKPTLYGLYWRSWWRPGEVPVALQNQNVLRKPRILSAVILHPALLTPAVHVRDPDEAKDRFEILITAPDMMEARFVNEVNLRLQVSAGLDAKKVFSYRPLSGNPADDIIVEKIAPPDGNGILRTPGGLRGILHPKFAFKDGLGAFYSVRISAALLEKAAVRDPDAPKDKGKRIDTQDGRIREILERLNGPALRDKKGFGFHCFQTDGAVLNLAMPDLDQPICAHHPLFVYPKGGLEWASVGHASDLHLNARQNVLRQSDARVIDYADAGGGGDALSKRIGSLVNVYSSNFMSVLNGLATAGADVVLLGGDLVDHAQNCFPYATGRVPAQGEPGNAAKVWGLVDLGDSYDTNYHAFVDLITLYSIVRHFTTTEQKPVFVVAGNHDAYEQAYGIAPRALGLVRANEGIPADHNLTFYEAILAFGETFGTIKRSFNFEPAMFEWFFNVLTPFSDYAVELPKQRVVGLHWGEGEEMISTHRTGHGFGHLPRADEAATAAQLVFAKEAIDSQKRAVLFTHFTFVSYGESIPNEPAGGAGPPATGHTGFSSRSFTDYDFGTVQQGREDLYRIATASAKVQCVLTGHSHRKGLYRLTPDGSGMVTEMWPIPMARVNAATEGRAPPAGDTPFIVSDCAGPLPRLNLGGEFHAWGSDRPAGTFVKISDRGAIERVVAVPATATETVPRVVVALEYLQVLQSTIRLSDEVFGAIETRPFPASEWHDWAHAVRFPLGRVFERVKAALVSAELYCKPSVKDDWVSVVLAVAFPKPEGLIWKSPVVTGFVPRESNRAFLAWLTAPAAGRFMSLKFKPLDPNAPVLNRYDWESRWNFEVNSRVVPIGGGGGPGDQGLVKYVIMPRFEAPNFDWRKKFPKYQA